MLRNADLRKSYVRRGVAIRQKVRERTLQLLLQRDLTPTTSQTKALEREDRTFQSTLKQMNT